MEKTKLSTALLKAAQLQYLIEDIFENDTLDNLNNHDRQVLMAIASECHGKSGCTTTDLLNNGLVKSIARATLQRSLSKLKHRGLIASSGGTTNKMYYL